MDYVLRLYLPIITLITFGLSFIWSSVRMYRATGINPLRFGTDDNTHNYIGKVMKILIATLILVVFQYGLNWNYELLLPIWYLQSAALQITGLILVHLSLAWIVYSQFEMGNSWRIGVDTQNETKLVTRGIFSISRNPIFLGMMGSIVSIFLIIPNMITFCVLALSFFVIQIQVRMEEEFLISRHGEVYKSYKQEVRRWL